MTSGFALEALPRLSRSTVDRREPLRDDESHQLEGWPSARVLPVGRGGRARVRADGTELVFVPATDYGDRPPSGAVLLGEQDGIAYWGVSDRESDVDGPEWTDLRLGGGLLNDTDAGLLVTAVAVLNWQRRAGFCARCGSPVRFVRAGWASRCLGCDHEEYPRTDPAVICLVHDGAGGDGEQVLLARQPSWPAQRYSVLAGFVEAGESLEATVCREILEEVGVAVGSVRYLGSQPWPFPRSLMLGFAAVADPAAPIAPADGEIAEAYWFSRADVRAAIDADGRPVNGLGLPGSTSIAAAMLHAWAHRDG